MKSIEIFVIGKYEYRTKLGTWIYYMSYKRAVKKEVGQVEDAGSPTRVALYALYKALESINEPCQIKVNSKVALGFKNPKESSNKELIIKIQHAINKAGHVILFNTTDDFGRVEIWEELYGKKESIQDTKQNNKRAKTDIQDKETPNEVFELNNKEPEHKHETDKNSSSKTSENKSSNWKDMYSDLMGPSNGAWVHGSGGY